MLLYQKLIYVGLVPYSFAVRIKNRLPKFGAHYCLLLPARNSRHGLRRLATQRSNSVDDLSRINYIILSYRWRSPLQDCTSKYAESGGQLALV